jgi:hypothetical protein
LPARVKKQRLRDLTTIHPARKTKAACGEITVLSYARSSPDGLVHEPQPSVDAAITSRPDDKPYKCRITAPRALHSSRSDLVRRPDDKSEIAGCSRAVSRARLGRDGVQPPLAGNTLELMGAPIAESNPRTDRADPGADVNGNAAKVIAEDLELSGVNAGPHP